MREKITLESSCINGKGIIIFKSVPDCERINGTQCRFSWCSSRICTNMNLEHLIKGWPCTTISICFWTTKCLISIIYNRFNNIISWTCCKEEFNLVAKINIILLLFSRLLKGSCTGIISTSTLSASGSPGEFETWNLPPEDLVMLVMAKLIKELSPPPIPGTLRYR